LEPHQSYDIALNFAGDHINSIQDLENPSGGGDYPILVIMKSECRHKKWVSVIADMKDQLTSTTTPSGDKIKHFPVENELAQHKKIYKYLKYVGRIPTLPFPSNNTPILWHTTCNALPALQSFLNEEECPQWIVRKLGFFKKVSASPTLEEEEKEKLEMRLQAEKLQVLVLNLWEKKLARDEFWASFWNYVTLAQEKKSMLEKAKKMKENRLKLRIKAAKKGPPMLIPDSNPPNYEPPSEDWDDMMNYMVNAIRSLVDLCIVQRGITLDGYEDILLSSNAFLTPVVKNIGGSIFMFRAEDFKDEATIKAQLRTWLPLPYMKLFWDYCELLYALHRDPMSDKDQETINKTVDSFIKSKAVPVKYQTFVEYMVKCLRDGYKFNPEEDDDSDKDEESDEDDEPEETAKDNKAAMLLRDLASGNPGGNPDGNPPDDQAAADVLRGLAGVPPADHTTADVVPPSPSATSE
jgi:hypothetical protein